MGLYNFLVNLYSTFLALFPPPVQWLVTLLVVIGLVVAFINLIRYNWLFLLLLILLLPVLFPIFQHFFTDIYRFFAYLLSLLGVAVPSA